MMEKWVAMGVRAAIFVLSKLAGNKGGGEE